MIMNGMRGRSPALRHHSANRKPGPSPPWTWSVLSQKTIRNNVSNVLAKLQAADRAQAIVRSRDAGLGHQFAADRR